MQKGPNEFGQRLGVGRTMSQQVTTGGLQRREWVKTVVVVIIVRVGRVGTEVLSGKGVGLEQTRAAVLRVRGKGGQTPPPSSAGEFRGAGDRGDISGFSNAI
mmetsp:Transcript_20025/g.57503  ORF Transcript_20025/g.57503 Transcript_20025/m.57503 type:complete len:102 (+) Transcript_20025:2209-2514(+)